MIRAKGADFHQGWEASASVNKPDIWPQSISLVSLTADPLATRVSPYKGSDLHPQHNPNNCSEPIRAGTVATGIHSSGGKVLVVLEGRPIRWVAERHTYGARARVRVHRMGQQAAQRRRVPARPTSWGDTPKDCTCSASGNRLTEGLSSWATGPGLPLFRHLDFFHAHHGRIAWRGHGQRAVGRAVSFRHFFAPLCG